MLKAAASKSADRKPRRGSDQPDLQTQFESLLDQVWRSEAQWRLFDRIDALCASEPDHCRAQAAPERRGSKR
jgi:hypothetical protein